MLKCTEQQHAWPTKHIQDRLMEAWDCSRSDSISYVQDIMDDDIVTVDGWLL